MLKLDTDLYGQKKEMRKPVRSLVMLVLFGICTDIERYLNLAEYRPVQYAQMVTNLKVFKSEMDIIIQKQSPSQASCVGEQTANGECSLRPYPRLTETLVCLQQSLRLR